LREEPDLDSDGVTDAEDNCVVASNPTQLDADQDGYGNACDADYDDDGSVGGSDFSSVRESYGTNDAIPGWEPQLDADGDGVVGSVEFMLVRGSFGGPPGPSGLACAGNVPCP
jgi:hypothetical protein